MDLSGFLTSAAKPQLAVIPAAAPILQALLVVLPAILVAVGSLIVTMFKPSTMKRVLHLLWTQKVAVLLIIAAVVGLIYLYGVLFPPVIDEVAAASDIGSSDWLLWRGGPTRRGFVPGSEEPGHGPILWTFSRDGIKDFYASPAIVGDRVYVTSARWEVFKKDGAIYSIEPETGKLVWKFKSDGYRATFSSPAVSGKYLVVGEGLHYTRDARVFCIDIEASEKAREGVKLWDFRTGSHVESSPCIADGKVFIGAGDDGMHCFQLEPGEDGGAKRLWHLEGKDYPDCETSPVYHEGKVYFGLGNGGNAIVCVSADDGKELWRLKTPCPVFGSPSIAGGKLYIGMGYGDFINTAEDVAAKRRDDLKTKGLSDQQIEEAVRDIKPGGEVWCVDLEAPGKPKWTFKTGRVILGAVAVADGKAYFGSRDEYFYCVSADTGTLVRKWNAHAPILTSPAVADEHVYVITETGQLYGLDKSDLSMVWDVSLGAVSMSSPSVARGHVYVGTKGNGLLCLGRPGREKEPPIWRGALGGPGRSGWTDGSTITARGVYGWGYAGEPEEGASERPQVTMDAPGAYLDEVFYVGFNAENASGLARLSFGDKLGGKPSQDWFAPSKNPIHLSAAGTGNSVFFVDGRPGDADRALHRLDPKTGRELSMYPVASDASGEFVITRDCLFVAATGKGLVCLDNEFPEPGKELWQAEVGPCVGAPLVGDDVIVVAVQSPPGVVAVDRCSGQVRWQSPLPSAPQTGPVLAAEKVWVGHAGGVSAARLADGKEPVTVACGNVSGTLVCDSDRLACVTSDGQLVVLNPATGDESARFADAVVGLAPLLAGDAMLYCAKGSIQRYDFAAAKAERWAKITASWPGNIVTPLVMVDSHVFFATDKRGFVCMKPKKG